MNYQDELNKYYGFDERDARTSPPPGEKENKITNVPTREEAEKAVADYKKKQAEAKNNTSDINNFGNTIDGGMMGDMVNRAKSMATQMGGVHFGGGMRKVANPKGKSSVKENKELAGIKDKKSVGQVWKELPTPVKYTAVAGSSVLGIILIKKLLLASIL